MYCVSVVYPNKDEGTFDFDYYLNKHMPMVRELVGQNLSRAEVRKGVASPDGSPPAFICQTSLWITSLEQFQETLNQHGEQIMADIPSYTNIEPVLQVDEVLGGEEA